MRVLELRDLHPQVVDLDEEEGVRDIEAVLKRGAALGRHRHSTENGGYPSQRSCQIARDRSNAGHLLVRTHTPSHGSGGGWAANSRARWAIFAGGPCGGSALRLWAAAAACSSCARASQMVYASTNRIAR